MKQERAIQRKVLTPYETSIVDKINSRIEFLDFIKNGIKFYGFEKYQTEIKDLKLERNFDSEPNIKIPYNLYDENEKTEKINQIIKVCIECLDDNSLTQSDIFSLKYRGDVTDIRHAMMNVIINHAKVKPTNCARIFNRSRQVVHIAINRLAEHIAKNKNSALLDLFNKMNKEVSSLFKINTKLPKIKNLKENPLILQEKVNNVLDIITKKVFEFNGNKVNFTPNKNTQVIINKQSDLNYVNSIIISSKNIDKNRENVAEYFNINTKQLGGVLLTHLANTKKSKSYSRKFNLIQKNVLQDKSYLKAKSTLDNYIKNQK